MIRSPFSPAPSFGPDQCEAPRTMPLDQLRTLEAIRTFDPGKAGHCQLLQGGIVRKVYTHHPARRMARETLALRKLTGYDHFPKLHCEDVVHSTIYMTYVGEPIPLIHRTQIPKDYLQQLDSIVTALKQADVFHRDLHLYHVTLLNGTLHVIDFEKSVSHEAAKSLRNLTYSDVSYVKYLVTMYFKLLTDSRDLTNGVGTLEGGS